MVRGFSPWLMVTGRTVDIRLLEFTVYCMDPIRIKPSRTNHKIRKFDLHAIQHHRIATARGDRSDPSPDTQSRHYAILFGFLSLITTSRMDPSTNSALERVKTESHHHALGPTKNNRPINEGDTVWMKQRGDQHKGEVT